MSYRRTAGAILATAILLTPGSVSGAGAATGQPFKDRSYVKAEFTTNTPSGTSARAYLQRHRWWGWQDLRRVNYYGGGYHATTLVSSCAGEGTYTYRLISQWTNALGRGFPWVISRETRFSC